MKKLILTILLSCFFATIYSQTITLYTKCGKLVEGLLLTELTSDEIEEANTFYTTTYSNATFLGSATRHYNCHSYAWNMTDGGYECWINATINTTNDNLGKYIHNDYYIPTTSSSIARKVFYYNSDHSAVVSTVSGMYESKWGRAPLMRHAPGYGPYPNMNQRTLYKRVDANGLLSCSNGDGTTSVGVVSTYTPNAPYGLPTGGFVTKTWSVYNAKGDDVTGTTANIQISGSSANISFSKMGFYEIYCTYKTGSEVLTTYWFEAIVE